MEVNSPAALASCSRVPPGAEPQHLSSLTTDGSEDVPQDLIFLAIILEMVFLD